ncbi:MAG: hypothetical protein IAI50_12785, partial [Candidatus Eremiobacteraeota bacterium]|nr:hypothetical protein [Candidatus Eremiobacteraeota bacterium]
MIDPKTLKPRHVAGIAAAALLAGCTSGNSAIEPPFQSANLATLGKLQFVVGTANIATFGAPFVGLNTVVTFRQKDGDTATAVNTPQIVGPPGFKVPAVSSAGSDAGGNTINSTPQGGASTPTFDSTVQATLYGFGPNNYDTSGTANFGDLALPIYFEELGTNSSSSTVPQVTFYGLPPAFTQNSTGVFPGYNPGFVYFAAAAVSGTYALNVAIPTSPGSSQSTYTYHASSTLNAAKVLPPLVSPTFTEDAAGGGTIVVPAFPAGVTSELVQLSDPFSGTTRTYNLAAAAAITVDPGTISGTDPFLLAAV